MRILIAALFAAFLTPTVLADDYNALAGRDVSEFSVKLDRQSENFTLIYSRMEETGTAGALFGLAGAAINSSINASEDAERAERFRETASQINVGELLQAGIEETLVKRELSNNPESPFVVSVRIKDWGIIKASFGEEEVTTFITTQVKMNDGKTKVYDTYFKESGKKVVTLEELSEELFASEITALAKKTGKRIAYEIVFR